MPGARSLSYSLEERIARQGWRGEFRLVKKVLCEMENAACFYFSVPKKRSAHALVGFWSGLRDRKGAMVSYPTISLYPLNFSLLKLHLTRIPHLSVCSLSAKPRGPPSATLFHKRYELVVQVHMARPLMLRKDYGRSARTLEDFAFMYSPLGDLDYYVRTLARKSRER